MNQFPKKDGLDFFEPLFNSCLYANRVRR
jgi:hypothetical protein